MDISKLVNSFKTGKVESNLSVDCVIFTIIDDKLHVLLTKLVKDLDLMLPGGFILKNETSDTAATRILENRTGVKNVYLNQFKIFSEPNRVSISRLFGADTLNKIEKQQGKPMPERIISIGYFALTDYHSINLTGGLFKETAYWTDAHQLPDLLFDHKEIVQSAIEALQKELITSPIAFNLLPNKFTMPELQKLYEVILNRPVERSSFQKKMLRWGIYERLEERKEGVAHKRPFLYRFNRKKYREAVKQGKRFAI